MKKVLMISTDRKIWEAESETRKRIAEYGQLAGELHVVMPMARPPDAPERDQIAPNVFVYGSAARFRLGACWQSYGIAERLMKSGGEWLVTAQDPFENGWLACWLARQFRCPIQLQIHTDFLSPYFSKESWKNKIRVLIAKRILRKADGVRVVSERIKKSLVEHDLVEDKKITVLPIFTDIAGIKNAAAGDLKSRFPGKDFFILMASRLTREKNIGLAIEAMAEVVTNHPRAALVIVGDGPELKSLKLLVSSYKLEQNVIFEPSTKGPFSYYKTADLFLLTSNYEGYGRVVVEAAAAGVPVVMTDVGVAIGRVVPLGNAKALAGALDDVISHNEVRAEIVRHQNDFLNKLPKLKEDYLRAYAESLRVRRGQRLLMITQKMDLDDDVLGVYHHWVVGLASKFEKISVICLYKGRTDLPPNVSVYSLGKEIVSSCVQYIFNFYKYIWKLRDIYDSVLVHMNPEYVILAGWFWKLLGKRLVLWYAHYLGNWKLRAAAIFPDAIVTSVRFAYPFASNKLQVLQQGIDTGFFTPGSKDEHKNLRLLFLGRIAPVKHVDTLLRAFAEALPKIGGATLTVLGGPTAGKPDEAAYYEKVRKLTTELGISASVLFQPPVPNFETPKIYRQHDVFVNLTDTGSFDKSTLEAMACGLPVLVSNRAFAGILPQPVQSLLMFREKDYHDLAEKIRRFSELPVSRRSAIGKDLRRIIETDHSLAGLIEKLHKVLAA